MRLGCGRDEMNVPAKETVANIKWIARLSETP